MGWWATDHEDDVMGDGPADSLGLAVDRLFATFAARGRGERRVPAVAEVVYALNQAWLAKPTLAWLGGGAPAGVSFVFRRADHTSVTPASSLAPEQVVPFAEALVRIVADYRVAAARPPRMTEWTHCLELVLQPDAEDGRYADGPVKLSVGLEGQAPEPTGTALLPSEPPDEADPYAPTMAPEIDRETLERVNAASDRIADEPDPDGDAAARIVLAESPRVRSALAALGANGSDALARRDPDRAIRELALMGVVAHRDDPDLIEAALGASSADVRLALARATREQNAVFARLACDSSARVRAAVAASPWSPEALRRELRRDAHPLVRASSLHSSANVLAALSLHQSVAVRTAVARNHGTAPAILANLARDTGAVLVAVAANEHTPAGVLVSLAAHAEAKVRAGVAGNAAIPEAEVARLAEDADVTVRQAVVWSFHQRSRIPLAILAKLAHDPQTRGAAERELKRRKTESTA